MWTDDNNGKNNVFMRDIAKHKTTQIEKSGTASTATSPAIYCNRIIWENWSKSGGKVVSDIYV